MELPANIHVHVPDQPRAPRNLAPRDGGRLRLHLL
jgi:hypothetical protein